MTTFVDEGFVFEVYRIHEDGRQWMSGNTDGLKWVADIEVPWEQDGDRGTTSARVLGFFDSEQAAISAAKYEAGLLAKH